MPKSSILNIEVTEALAARDEAKQALSRLTSDHQLTELRAKLSDTLVAMRTAPAAEALDLASQVAGLERLLEEHGRPVRGEVIDQARQTLRRRTAEAAKAATRQHEAATQGHYTALTAAVTDVFTALDQISDERMTIGTAAGLGIADEREAACRRAANELARILNMQPRPFGPKELAAERGR